jgi:putative ABC transport system permease protein
MEIGNRKSEARNLEGRTSHSSTGLQVSIFGFRISNFQFPVSNFAFRIWWRALAVKRPQAAVAMGSLLVGALVSSTLLNLYKDVRRKMTHEFAAYGPNVVLAQGYVASPAQLAAAVAPAYSPESPGNLMDESVLTRLEPLRRRVTGLAAAPTLYVVVRVDRVTRNAGGNAGQSADPDNAVAVGTDFAALRRLNPSWHLQGSAQGSAPAAWAIGEHLAAQLHVAVGDAVRVQTVGGSFVGAKTVQPEASAVRPYQVFSVSDVLTTGASEDDQIFLPLGALQQLAGLAGKISLVQLNIPGEPAEIEGLIRELSQLFPGVEVRPIRQIVYSEGRVLGTLRWLVASLTGLILIIIALCVTATVTAIVLERRKDIAVMKALGSSDGRVMRLFLSEVATLGLLGGLAGSIVGAFLARSLGQRLFGVTLNLSSWTLPTVGVASVLLAVLAAMLPIRVVRRIQPATMLKGE